MVTVEASSLKGYMEIQNGRSIPQTREVEMGGGGGVTYVVSFPQVLNTVRFLVTDFLAVAHSAGRLREHFMNKHFFPRIVVVQ